MDFKVFYAWQMDRPKKVCRWFIHKAAEVAVQAVSKDLLVEDAPPIDEAERETRSEGDVQLDWATKDEPGTPNIAETILRKIQHCGVFLADVSLVAETVTADGRKKYLPNSNVMIELGAAVMSVGWERIILVMNTAFGGPEGLPFDLRHRSFPITYTMADPTDPKRESTQKTLTKDIAEKLRVMKEKGVYTKEHEEAVQQAAERAEHERKRFEDEVKANKFHDFKADLGVIAVSIVPAVPPKQPLILGASKEVVFHDKLLPIGGAYPGRLDFLPKSLAFKYPVNGPPVVLTELMEDGSIWAVFNLGQICDFTTTPKESPWPFALGDFQGQIVSAICRYLIALKSFGILGPWFVGLSMLKMHNVLLIPSRTWQPMGYRRRVRPFEGQDMILDAVFVSPDQELTERGIAERMERSFIQLWRHCGYHGMPTVQSDGSITWKE